MAIHEGAATGGLIVAMILIAFGSGGLRSSISPFIGTYILCHHNRALLKQRLQLSNMTDGLR